MEQKNLKTPVFTYETVFSDSAEVPVDIDFSLPDYCPDIKKILKCRAVSRISSKGMNGRNITTDGTVTVTVIYCDEDNRLCSYEYQYPFSKAFEIGSDCDDSYSVCTTKCEYINCRAVTARKIDIHGAIIVNAKLQRRKCTDVISDIDDMNVELLRGTAPATLPMGYAEKYLIIEEEIEIGQGQPCIRSLIRYDADVSVKESKLLANKSMIKGEMLLNLLYSPDSGSEQCLKTTIPFSQLLEIDGVTEECQCNANAEIAFIEVKPHALQSGESKSFQLNAKILITCESFCNNDVDVIFDAYSKKYEADIIRNSVCFDKICRNIAENFSCKKNIEFQDASLTAISDLWCDVHTDNIRTEEKDIIICGTVNAFIIAMDESGEPLFFEKPVAFEYRYTMETASEELSCVPHIKVTSANYILSGANSVELRIELFVNASVYQHKFVPLITDINIDEERRIKKKDRGAMTLYFASGGEYVWDIAHRYLASVEEIKEINDITEDTIEIGKMIMIPMN